MSLSRAGVTTRLWRFALNRPRRGAARRGFHRDAVLHRLKVRGLPSVASPFAGTKVRRTFVFVRLTHASAGGRDIHVPAPFRALPAARSGLHESPRADTGALAWGYRVGLRKLPCTQLGGRWVCEWSPHGDSGACR
jgi:hypothetical protein